MSFSNIKNYIGIDVSKSWLDIAIISSKYKSVILEFKCDNTSADLKLLKEKLRSNQVHLNKTTLVILEHSGLYARPLLKFLIKYKCLICLESSLQIKKSLGIQRGKNDNIDSRRIAEYGLRNGDKLRIWKNPRETILQLKDILVLRERLVRIIKAVETPIRELDKFYNRKELTYLNRLNSPASKGLQQSMIIITSEIKRIIKEDLPIKRLVNLLISVPGIGIINALYLICYTHEFSISDSGKRLASYMGVAPFAHTSGTSVRGKTRISQIANKKMKALIYSAAVTTVRKNGEFRDYYDRKLLEGKHKISILTAICNKILRRASAVIRRGTPYIKKSSYYPAGRTAFTTITQGSKDLG